MVKAQDILGPMRVPFLILAPVCVLVGVGTASYSGAPMNLWHILLVMVGGICTHISVNAFNEYDDFKSGLDARTQRTPFSGGGSTLPAKQEAAQTALVTVVITLIIVVLVGVYFTRIYGAALIPLGLLGILVIVAYTPWLTRNPWLCLIAPGLGFGPVIVMGAHFAFSQIVGAVLAVVHDQYFIKLAADGIWWMERGEYANVGGAWGVSSHL